jgi:hypothetical protein
VLRESPCKAPAMDGPNGTIPVMHAAADEPESHARLAAFMQGLQKLGWAVLGRIVLGALDIIAGPAGL